MTHYSIDRDSWRALLQWWSSGLRDCLPERFRGRFAREHRLVLAERSGGGFVLESQAGGSVDVLAQYPSLDAITLDRWPAGRAARGKPALVVRVPDDRVFARELTLPVAAAGNLDRVLRFEMDRLTPFAAADVLFDHRLVARKPEKGQIVVELAALPKAAVEATLTHLESLGLRPRAVDAAKLWPGANLMQVAGASARRRAGAYRGAWAAVTLLLVAAVVTTPLWQARLVAAELGDRLQRAREQAAVVARLQRRLEEKVGLANFLVERQRERVPTADILRELTVRLPDDTWLQELSIRGDKVGLQGESTQATRLIELLEASPRFTSVAFRAPLTKARRGGEAERFSIDLALADDRGEP